MQWAAEASQNFTCPVVTGAVPPFTVAVSVITPPDAIVDAALPPDVMAKVAVVAVGAAQPPSAPKQKTAARVAVVDNWRIAVPISIAFHIRVCSVHFQEKQRVLNTRPLTARWRTQSSGFDLGLSFGVGTMAGVTKNSFKILHLRQGRQIFPPSEH